MKFPDLVHSVKAEPHNNIPSSSTGHNNFWDFISLTPESTHMLTWLFSDRGTPASYRMVEGFGVNTYKWVSNEGKEVLIKYHWKPPMTSCYLLLCRYSALPPGSQLPPATHQPAALYHR
ncbi:MAG: catalase [Methanothrix sp.]|nr:MAG: catalase [Methanothrix sp.]